MAQPEWTQDQGIAYAVARDCINDVIAIYSSAIHEERSKVEANQNRIALLRLRRDHCAALLHTLQVTDDASVQEIRRDFGAIARADQFIINTSLPITPDLPCK